MFLQNQYPTHEAFYLALKAQKDAAFSYLRFKLEASVAKLCRKYHLTTPEESAEDILQETLETVFVNLGTGKYKFNYNEPASPVTYALAIARNKVATKKKEEDKLKTDDDLEDLMNEPDNQDITNSEIIDAIVKHLHTNMDEISARLIWFRNAEDKAYRDIVAKQLMPEFTHEVGLRNKMKKSWDKWMELLKKDGFF
jgi:DNA-directed RNA polymerase specialized sigma24 family protein